MKRDFLRKNLNIIFMSLFYMSFYMSLFVKFHAMEAEQILLFKQMFCDRIIEIHNIFKSKNIFQKLELVFILKKYKMQ